ncbi:hypothetical protein [Paenibacillus thiaminolyticus]|uniref:Uncharacterized protein n=1 Tax=Paenibacillus thiaminolyticus TaxID=49283 RepID=A0A3A3GYW2_PANTH|nr:hypothetical protein [Paenibacillus thiaminolyticus]RJG23502.1 hypothetical protein DQX05_12600 [Paenibacillus thiaminolyticus]
MAAKLQKAVKEFAGKEIKLNLQDASLHISGLVEVKSADGKYGIDYQQKTGEIITITGNQSIDKVSMEDQNEVLKVLKGWMRRKTIHLIKKFMSVSTITIKEKRRLSRRMC